MLKNILGNLIIFLALTMGYAHAGLNFDGDWKVVNFKIPIPSVTEREARKNIGKIATIKSNILTVKLSGTQFECEILVHPGKIPAEKCGEFNPYVKNSVRIKDFNFTDDVYYFHSQEVNGKNYNFRDVIFDAKRKKMVLVLDGAFYLLQRM
jgi:hypothetical protein